MLHPAKARLNRGRRSDTSANAGRRRLTRERPPLRGAPLVVARRAERHLRALRRPPGDFDASLYFRGAHDLVFYNVRTPVVRALARSIVLANRDRWSIAEGAAFADALMTHAALEVKGLAVEVLARYRRSFHPSLLLTWKRWLSLSLAANWATTDAICGSLIGPLLLAHPELASRVASWTGHPTLWVRRASAVALIPSVRQGRQLDLGYAVASALAHDDEDLMHKAVGWLLREAGKTDPARLERYLRENGSRLPRTAVRYAIERFPATLRASLLVSTRGGPALRPASPSPRKPRYSNPGRTPFGRAR